MTPPAPWKIITWSILITVISAGCGHVLKDGKKISATQVIIRSCAANDLGQVIVFTEGREGEKNVFVKDFYAEGRSRESIAGDIRAYMQKVDRLRSKRVTVRYYMNYAGNREIESIALQ